MCTYCPGMGLKPNADQTGCIEDTGEWPQSSWASFYMACSGSPNSTAHMPDYYSSMPRKHTDKPICAAGQGIDFKTGAW